MPRKRRASKAKITELTYQQFFDLWLHRYGEKWREDSPFENPFMRRVAWFANRDEIMTSSNAAMRSAGWWDYEAPEPRRLLGQPAFPGKLLCTCGEFHDGFICEFESDEDYLRRLGLLEPWEEAELEAMKRLKGKG
ncbi:MAG: hypothetical protein ACYC55_02930 [Candidatus Geothermincolia bacterium]